jgi:phenylalanyl-tRNA synthetase beta chain
MPTPLLSADDLRWSGLDVAAVTITNPLAAEESLLRTSLRPGLLRAVAHNTAHRVPQVCLFEVGRVFTPPSGTAVLPEEPEMVALVLAGQQAPAAVHALDVVADALGVAVELEAAEPEGLHPTRSAHVLADGQVIGVVGEIDPDVNERWGLVGPVAWLELDLAGLEGAMTGQRTYQAVSRFPSADVDLAFELSDEVPAARLRALMAEAAGPLLVRLELFDVYRGGGVAEGTRSLAHRLRLQATDRTLTEAEVGEVRQRVVDAVVTGLPASLRS